MTCWEKIYLMLAIKGLISKIYFNFKLTGWSRKLVGKWAMWPGNLQKMKSNGYIKMCVSSLETAGLNTAMIRYCFLALVMVKNRHLGTIQCYQDFERAWIFVHNWRVNWNNNSEKQLGNIQQKMYFPYDLVNTIVCVCVHQKNSCKCS